MTSTMIWTTIVAQTVKQVTFATDSVDDGLSYPENNDVLRLSWKIMYWRLTCKWSSCISCPPPASWCGCCTSWWAWAPPWRGDGSGLKANCSNCSRMAWQHHADCTGSWWQTLGNNVIGLMATCRWCRRGCWQTQKQTRMLCMFASQEYVTVHCCQAQASGCQSKAHVCHQANVNDALLSCTVQYSTIQSAVYNRTYLHLGLWRTQQPWIRCHSIVKLV